MFLPTVRRTIGLGPSGAYAAWWSFLMLGVVGYFLPFLIAVFGAAYLMGFLHYLREHLRWSLLWSFGLLVSLTGLLISGGPWRDFRKIA